MTGVMAVLTGRTYDGESGLACIVKQHYALAKKLDVIALGFTKINAEVYTYQLQVYYEQCTAYTADVACAWLQKILGVVGTTQGQ